MQTEETTTQETPIQKIKSRGTRQEVFEGQALKTGGGLRKDDIVYEKNKYKSKKAVQAGRNLIERLRKPKSLE